MIRYLLDTDWIIDYLNGLPGAVRRLDELKEQGLAISVVSLAEHNLLIGAIALHHNLTLLSNNRRHFELIEGLRLESV